ncbi:MAG: VCBS repeat-containing protein [Chitinophagaceae bacterium]|nr:VCBS repeat-containing protein [Chitinophagaceae bacterium]
MLWWLSILIFAWSVAALTSCNDKKPAPLFHVLDSKSTGLDFTNKLTPTPEFNMFKYMYFYNGAGVGAGDFNNDGQIDLFFAANQAQNKLYLNIGKLQFRDVTTLAGIPVDRGWSTGVSVVDINSDGRLDIYVCRVGNYESLQSKNQFLINQGNNRDGIPVFKEMAASLGLDFSGFSTQAAFLDFDLDGDLDMYLLNHSLRFNGTFNERKSYLNTYDSLAGDRFYRNDNSRFIDITRPVAINSSIIGYGLGIAVSDINLDGYPDIYVGNDFHENDYLYINQKNGTFKEELTDRIMHTSQFSMGVDVADINNDAWPEIISMDMLPSDPYILKRSLGEDAYDIFNFKIRHGYNYQYTRNNLQLNRGNGLFSEVGLYAGVFATDWSWAPLWVDFDNDGNKDLFISNGIPKRLNDIDYVNYVSNDELQNRIRSNSLKDQDMVLINKFPEIKLPNKFYQNAGNVSFDDIGARILGDRPTFSNGAAFADLDNDGDLDIVVNNIDDAALIYENRSDRNDSTHQSVQLKLNGPPGNINAIGARVIVFADSNIISYEKSPVHGFQSSMEIPLHIGIGKLKIDSILVIWPDRSFQSLPIQSMQSSFSVVYKSGLLPFDFTLLTNRTRQQSRAMIDVTAATALLYKHLENPFNEFDREPLIPHMVSREGPGIATADINGDGLDDVFIGSSKGNKPALFLQENGGKFSKSVQPALEIDSMFEEIGAVWIDVNRDKVKDLVIASGGNEYYAEDEHLTPRVFLNDGRGNLTKRLGSFDKLFLTASCIVASDFTGDGLEDLFIGGRAVPFEYGAIPTSYLLANDGNGHFTNATDAFSKELGSIGFVTDANWADLDNDGDEDLLIALEWGGIVAFIKEKDAFVKKSITDKKGWWNVIRPIDIDNDGDLDLVAGNLGLNTRLKASKKEPVRMYYHDFDGNGRNDQVLTYFLNGKEISFANKEELQKQLPGLKKQFLYAEDFAKASLKQLLGDRMEKAAILSADYFSNAILINDGNFNFRLQAMPWEAQLTSIKDAVAINANNDSLPDILIAGNFYENNIQMGRYDADYGSVLINRGSGRFEYQLINGLAIKGQVKHLSTLQSNGQQLFIVARNNDSLHVIRFK